MGDMYDYYLECMENRASYRTNPNLSKCIFGSIPQEDEVLWKTRDGNIIAIKDMTTSHIINSIAKCKRDKWRTEGIQYLEAELNKRKKG